MQTITKLNPEFVGLLNEYRDWAFAPKIQDAFTNKIIWQPARLHDEGRSHLASSVEYLNAIDHDKHVGYPLDQHGLNLNYNFLKTQRRSVDPAFFDEVRQMNNDIDENLQNAIGARFCALKMYYPKDGYIGWHTNWNVPGYNIIFTYSESGNGHWRHIDSKGANTYAPNTDRLVHIDDVPGWHCKVGYFGSKEQHDRIVWHSALTNEPRLTLSYVVFDQNIWENMVSEIDVSKSIMSAS